ncbi:MAG: TIGR02147 family protein, partial [Bdellovibrionales bacterium]|nr:TIGR02147 family protein [Bdellovibrionales bacterium]
MDIKNTGVQPQQNRVFSFKDLREFLRCHFEEVKLHDPSWSYTAWSKELGLASTSALTMVVRGQRLPGPKFVEKLADYFDFSQSERDYFFDLVRLQKLTDNPR